MIMMILIWVATLVVLLGIAVRLSSEDRYR